MSNPLVIAVSPYHLATCEAPALCALLLADQVVTLMPGPESGSDRPSFDLAVRRSPRFIRFMERIRWSVPLWNAGVIAGEWFEEELAAGLREVCTRAADDDAMLGMRKLFDAASREGEYEFLDHVCTDLLKGGPDPAVSIPIAACVDEFAARHGIPVARSTASSVAQRAEAMMHRRRYSFAMPILAQASGRRILGVRERLCHELDALRSVLVRSLDSEQESSGERGGADEVAEAARTLTTKFEEARKDLIRGDDDSGLRVRSEYVSVSVVKAPSDAVFRSSTNALRNGAVARGGNGSRHATAQAAGVTTPASRHLSALVIKPLNLRPSP